MLFHSAGFILCADHQSSFDQQMLLFFRRIILKMLDYLICRRNIGAAGKKIHWPCDRSVGITRYAEETSGQQVKNTSAV
jgi:hypothetical protein